MMKIHLAFSLLDAAEDKYLAVTAGNDDIPIGVVINGPMKSAFEVLQNIFDKHQAAVLRVIREKSGSIISFVHNHATANPEIAEWATAPVIGLSESNEIEPGLFEVKFMVAGPSARLMHGFVDKQLFDGLVKIIKDYNQNPSLYYDFFINHNNIFLSKILKAVGK